MKYIYEDLLKFVKYKKGIINKWICAFDYDSNQIINIKPQLVNITYINLYHVSFFIEELNLNKYDGNWDYIYIFDEEHECIEYYNDLVWDVLTMLKEQIELQKYLYEKHQNEFINTDYVIEKLKRG